MGWTTQELEFSYLQGQEIFLFCRISRLALGHTRPIQWLLGSIALGIKQEGHDADHSPPSRAEPNIAWNWKICLNDMVHN
jgi:hypothetical protein